MLPPKRLLTLPCLLASEIPLLTEATAEGLRMVDAASPFALGAGRWVEGGVVTTPVNLFLTLTEAVIPSVRLAAARLARELMLRDMAACCCCCLAKAVSLFCAWALAVVFFVEPPPTKVFLVALITVFRSVEAARVGPLSATFLSDEDEATLNLYGIPSRSGRVTWMTTVFFSGGMSRTVFCSASWSSETARRRRFVRGASVLEAWRTVAGFGAAEAAMLSEEGSLALATGGTGRGRR